MYSNLFLLFAAKTLESSIASMSKAIDLGIPQHGPRRLSALCTKWSKAVCLP